MTSAHIAKIGAQRVVIGIGFMVAGLAVAYFGGAMAPKPELVNAAAERGMLVLMLIGIVTDLNGVATLHFDGEQN